MSYFSASYSYYNKTEPAYVGEDPVKYESIKTQIKDLTNTKINAEKQINELTHELNEMDTEKRNANHNNYLEHYAEKLRKNRVLFERPEIISISQVGYGIESCMYTLEFKSPFPCLNLNHKENSSMFKIGELTTVKHPPTTIEKQLHPYVSKLFDEIKTLSVYVRKISDMVDDYHYVLCVDPSLKLSVSFPAITQNKSNYQPDDEQIIIYRNWSNGELLTIDKKQICSIMVYYDYYCNIFNVKPK